MLFLFAFSDRRPSEPGKVIAGFLSPLTLNALSLDTHSDSHLERDRWHDTFITTGVLSELRPRKKVVPFASHPGNVLHSFVCFIKSDTIDWNWCGTWKTCC